jgi:hypothetical protein
MLKRSSVGWQSSEVTDDSFHDEDLKNSARSPYLASESSAHRLAVRV